ncbi:hypothetical protein PIB30_041775 [Stylosanthes scabra]|uniref:Uncharacterized protein n=1 Tax=Stylosanthes scabra TaxID=79078 RepID=A0ABU6UFI2_9FABA|nr:hypothetical protein [Stylosanthes scabra]
MEEAYPKELRENQRRINAQLTTLTLSAICLVTQFTNEVHECLGDVEVQSVDQEVEDVDNEPKGMKSVHSISFGETPPKLPSELHFEWEMESLELDELSFITCEKSEFKAYNGHLHKLHNNRGKVGVLSLRKHLRPWQFQKELVDSQNNGLTNQVWDLGKSYKSQHFWGLITCLGILAN